MSDTKRNYLPFIVMMAIIWATLGIPWLTGCGNNAAGYRALTVTVKAGNETGKTMAAVCKAQRLSCTKKFGAVRTVELEECLRDCYKALTAWVKYVKPAINTSVGLAFAGLETARAAKKVDSTWIAKLRPAVCALIKGLGEWKALLGKKAESLLSLLGSVEKIACQN
jgi:hypothetical protein